MPSDRGAWSWEARRQVGGWPGAGAGAAAVFSALLVLALAGCAKVLPKDILAFDLGKGVRLDLVRIPAGSFMMGSDKGRSSEKPVHRVTIAKPFYMGKYEITQEQWRAVMGDGATQFYYPRRPVERVSWCQCMEFLKKLAVRTRRGFALPTEAEWEYACRAGSTTEYCFGDDDSELGDYAWHCLNSDQGPHPVGQKKPNAWGLYDMHGNVWEWCQDLANDDYEGAPTDGSAWLDGGQGIHILRGGSWFTYAPWCRSASRIADRAQMEAVTFGVRVVLRGF